MCEVDIFVERDSYKCGQVEVPANGFVINKDNQTVEYSCNDEYRLIGDSIRTCNVKTGQWLNNEPYCERITCQSPPSIANGMYRVYNDYLNVPVIGTRTVYECNPGFILTGLNDTRVCDATGEWNGSKPYCEGMFCHLIKTSKFKISFYSHRLWSSRKSSSQRRRFHVIWRTFSINQWVD